MGTYILLILVLIAIAILFILKNEAWNSEDECKARNAVNKITNQNKLAYIVGKARLTEIRMIAVTKITDQILLQKITDHTDYTLEIILKAIEGITDQNILADIAKYNNRHEVRKAAVEKMSDQACLRQVFFDAFSEESVQKIALSKIDLSKIDSKEHLESILNIMVDIKKTKNFSKDFRYLALISIIKKGGNHDLVRKILFDSACDKEIKRGVLDAITDQTILAKITTEYRWSTDVDYNKSTLELRLKAFQKITDQESIKYVFLNVNDFSIKEAALSKITEPHFLTVIAQDQKHYDSPIQCLVIEKISDRNVLEKLAKNNDGNIRCTAEKRLKCVEVSNINDQKTLEEIALNNHDWDIKICAFETMDERNNVIVDALKGLKNGALRVRPHRERQSYVNNLIHLLSSDSFAAKVFWKEAAKISATEHTDGLEHEDSSSHSSDCNTIHSDFEMHRHQDTGIGITFPPYPFED